MVFTIMHAIAFFFVKVDQQIRPPLLEIEQVDQTVILSRKP